MESRGSPPLRKEQWGILLTGLVVFYGSFDITITMKGLGIPVESVGL